MSGIARKYGSSEMPPLFSCDLCSWHICPTELSPGADRNVPCKSS